jgi:hypothetical protein
MFNYVVDSLHQSVCPPHVCSQPPWSHEVRCPQPLSLARPSPFLSSIVELLQNCPNAFPLPSQCPSSIAVIVPACSLPLPAGGVIQQASPRHAPASSLVILPMASSLSWCLISIDCSMAVL